LTTWETLPDTGVSKACQHSGAEASPIGKGSPRRAAHLKSMLDFDDDDSDDEPLIEGEDDDDDDKASFLTELKQLVEQAQELTTT
jgi:hypothetical protein